MDLIVIIEFG